MWLYTWEVTGCAIFYTPLSAREYSKMKQKYPPNWIITCSEMGANKGKQTLADFVYNWKVLLADICSGFY